MSVWHATHRTLSIPLDLLEACGSMLHGSSCVLMLLILAWHWTVFLSTKALIEVLRRKVNNLKFLGKHALTVGGNGQLLQHMFDHLP